MAHFTLSGSREQAKFGLNDNQRFWPIRGGNTLRPVRDCLQLPAAQAKNVQPGSQMTLTFEIGNGASHVGMCKASLIDRSTGKTVNSLGTLNNCVANGASLPIQIPSNPGCSQCVIKTEVTATHIPTNPEDYDSCLDVNISGGSSSKEPPSRPVPSPSPSEPSVEPTPSLDITPGRGGRDETDPLPVPGRNQVVTSPGGSGCDANDPGTPRCAGDQQYNVCVYGRSIPMQCPAGTKCKGEGTSFQCA
ncbi:hypothetical protein BKA69DRAFT_1034967 [Paraphysoderma sedebokerense]|nr:hypothetical protein BKA69DRAFT_1034967 [Paraphysoderma sedebokerense]